MKHACWLLCCFWPGLALGFATYGAEISSLEKKVQLESWDAQADITVTEVIRNDGPSPAVFNYVLPTFGLSAVPTVYWQAEGQSVTALNRETAAQTVFSAAKQAQQPLWLSALDESFDAWWQVQNLRLAPGQTGTLKYTLQQNLGYFEGFYLGQLFLADGQSWETFTIDFVRAGNPRHVQVLPGNWQWERGPQAWAGVWETTRSPVNQPLRYFLADTDEASLRYNYAGAAYQADFKPALSPNFDNIVVVLDRSGSVYGPRWVRLQQAFKTLLESWSHAPAVRVALWGKDWQWLDEDWQTNRRSQQQAWLKALESAKVQGASNPQVLLAELESLKASVPDNTALVLMGDWSALEPDDLQAVAQAPWKVLMVDFLQPGSAEWALWWSRWNGQYQALFNQGLDFIEADRLRSAWQALGLRWPSSQTVTEPSAEAFAPQHLNSVANQRSVQQLPAGASTSILAEAVPRWWAGRKLGHYLREYDRTQQWSEATQAAVLSIAHSFGLEFLGLMGSASPEDLKTVLANHTVADRWQTIGHLEAGPMVSEKIKHWRAKPYYQTSRGWQPFDWETYPHRGEILPLPLWSNAHRALFVAQSGLLATPLSWGQAAFCAGQRCAQVLAAGEAEPQATDALFWQPLAMGHWAQNYWADLVWDGVLSPENNNSADWSQPVSRGQFLTWLVQLIEPNAVLPVVEGELFPDISAEQIGASQALWLHQKGLFKGYSDGTARLDQPLKRIEALKLLLQTQGLDIRHVLGNFDPQSPFTDLVGWTQPWAQAAYNLGLVQGYDDRTFRPFGPLTQAEAFKLLVEGGVNRE